MFFLNAEKNKLTVLQREMVTSGSINVYRLRFEFSPCWADMEKTVVFRAGTVSRSALLDEDGECAIPWELLTEHGRQLSVGVFGTRDGNIVLPTIWANLGLVQEGVHNCCTGSRPPTPDLWQQELAKKGDRLDYTEQGELGLYAGDKLLSSVEVSGGWGVGHGLKVVEGDLSVDAVDNFSGDNTLPMTAAGVQTVVGNIDVLLGTI